MTNRSQAVRLPIETPYGSFINGWRIINLDKREVIVVPDPPIRANALAAHNQYEDKELQYRSGEPFTPIDILMNALLEPMTLPFDQLPKPAIELSECAFTQDVGGFTGLPNEVLLCIFQAFDSLRDATNLCLTSSRMLALGYRSVALLNRRTLAPWAEDRIIVVRARLTLKDLEALDPSHLSPFRRALTTIPVPDTLRPGGDLYAHFEMHESNRPAGLLQGYERFTPNTDPASSITMVLKRSPGFDWQRYGGVVFYDYPLDISWAACNITKREYVILRRYSGTGPEPVASHTTEHCGQTEDPRTRKNWACLMRAHCYRVLMKLCWSTSVHGSWAGDQITILALDKAQSRYGDWAEWKNIRVSFY